MITEAEGMSTEGDTEAGHFIEYVSDTETSTTRIQAHSEELLDGENNHEIAETDRWASSLKSMLEDVPRYTCNPGHPGRIGRIPQNLREVDMKSYEPCYLSFGPYHHGKQSLQRMERKKRVVLKCFLQRRPDIRLKHLLEEIKTTEPKARSEKFVNMLLLDSLYLVIVFCGMEPSQERVNHQKTINWSSMDNEDNNDSENTEMNDMTDRYDDETISEENYRSGSRWFWIVFTHDLFLLENQLPFFVLQKMHNLVFGGSKTPLIATIKGIFRCLLVDYVKLDSEMVISSTDEVHHLLHLCHKFFRPTLQHDSSICKLPESNQLFRLGSAVQLYEAGVSFEAKSGLVQHSLLDITFNSSGKMTIPSLHVDDNTNSLLRNLIALEQMKYPTLGLDVSAYTVLLLHLITIPEDVKLLRKKGIIQHHLSSDKEMMHLVNRLSVGLSFDYLEDTYSLKPVFQELKRYSDHRVPRWRAWLKHKYFNNPWTTVSLIAASLLLLSAVQTFYSVYSYYHSIFDGYS